MPWRHILVKMSMGDWLIPRVRPAPDPSIGAPGIGKHRSWNRRPENAVALVAYSITTIRGRA